MATPPKLTQAKALLAVLSSASISRREREYWTKRALISDFYPIEFLDNVLGSISIDSIALETRGHFSNSADNAYGSVSISSVIVFNKKLDSTSIDYVLGSVSIGSVMVSDSIIRLHPQSETVKASVLIGSVVLKTVKVPVNVISDSINGSVSIASVTLGNI